MFGQNPRAPFTPSMKFSVAKDKLLEGLQTVQNVVSTRTTLPILSNVLIRAENGALHLTTNDLDVGMSCSVEAKIEKPGGTTIPARRLAGIAKELPASEVSVEVDGKNVASLRCGPSFFKMLCLPEDEFPALPKLEKAKAFTLQQKVLKDALRKTSYGISTDETRYVLNGILFSFKENKLTLVATDGRRLALVDLEAEFPRSNEVDVVIPAKCITELQRLLGEEGEVKLAVGENHVSFEAGGKLLVSKLIEGNYPNYRQVIPAESRERITIERELLLNAVRRVSLLSSEKSNSVKLIFTKNNLEIAANTPEIGEAHESLAISFKGKDFSVAFNPIFLQDPLRNLTEDEIHLEVSDEMSPGVIKIGTPFLYVLMPMRIS
jgi:DNA polymerase-3 subunit beta